MYVQESGQLEKVKEKVWPNVIMNCVYVCCIAQLKKTNEGAGSIAKIDQAADIISQLDPQYYYSFYHDEDKAHELVATTESSSASLPRTRGKIMECLLCSSVIDVYLLQLKTKRRRKIKPMILKLQ